MTHQLICGHRLRSLVMLENNHEENSIRTTEEILHHSGGSNHGNDEGIGVDVDEHLNGAATKKSIVKENAVAGETTSSSDSPSSSQKSKVSWFYFLCALVILFSTIGVIVTIVLLKPSKYEVEKQIENVLLEFIPNLPKSKAQESALNWILKDRTSQKLIPWINYPSEKNVYALLERFVLATFYFGLRQEQKDVSSTNEWTAKSRVEWTAKSWLTEKSVCEWEDILCEHKIIHNIRLTNLESKDFTGLLPSEFGLLTGISLLTLKTNLSGTIPTELGALTALKELDLSSNRLTGSIPTEIAKLTAITSLGLSSNGLTGSIPTEIGMLTEMIYLNLSTNNLLGSIPTELGEMVNLDTFLLSSNNLSGSIPTELGRLAKVYHLSLASNNLSGTIPTEFGQMSWLQVLVLENNNLTGTVPSQLSKPYKDVDCYLEGNIDLIGDC